MKKLILILLLAVSNSLFAQSKTNETPNTKETITKKESKDTPEATKEDLPGVIIQDKMTLEDRTKRVAEKELELANREKEIQSKAAFLESARKQLVENATNAKIALDNREKEVQQKETNAHVKRKHPAVTKSLGDLIQDVSKKHPLTN
jgi:hypothetical protein